MKRTSFLMLATLATSFALPLPAAFAAPEAVTAIAAPTATIAPETNAAASVIKNFYAQLVSTMKQGEQLGFNGRFKKLQPAVDAAFDMPTMTRLSVGLVWTKATPDEQKQLIQAFTDFSTANYAHNFVQYNGEQFDVIDEKPIKDDVLVETKLTPKDHAPVALNYLMHQDSAGSWRIVDVFLDGSISELATRRSEFSSIANRDGIAALVNSLGTKSKSMGPS